MRFPELTQTLSMEQHYQQSAENLKAAWGRLREADPRLRIRDAAEQLGVSEAELLALNCGGTATRLAADWAELIRALPKLGRVMALTRNDHAVHEKHGRYAGDAGQAGGTGPDGTLELWLFPERWRFGFAVVEPGHGGERHSLQFFDAYGCAVHKVYLVEASHRPAYENLVERYAAPDQSPWQKVTPAPFPVPEADPDLAGVQEEWRRLQEAHGFLSIFAQREIGRLQALQLAGRDLARPVSNASAEHVLTLAAGECLPVEISVSSPGAVQAHSGTVRNIRRTGPWINVLDEDFNLHLRDARVASTWVVREPAAEDSVTSLELFDGQGRPVVRFRSEHRPGQPEPGAWRDVLEALPAAEIPA